MNFRLIYLLTLLIGKGDSDKAGESPKSYPLVLNACPETLVNIRDIKLPVYDYDSNAEIVLFRVNKTSSSNCGSGGGVIKSVFINTNETRRANNTDEVNFIQVNDERVRISGDYYPLENYCILGYNQTHIDLKICPKSKYKNSSELYLPKCCGLNEILELNGTIGNPMCRPSRHNTWKPFMYKNPYERSSFPVTEFQVEEGYYHKYMDECQEFKKLSARNVFEISRRWKKSHWRLLNDGSITILSDYRQWERFDTKNFCVDGLSIGNRTDRVYSGNEEDQILLICSKSYPVNQAAVESQKDLLYCLLCYVSAFFYLLTTVVYLIIFSKTNSNVWTILGHIGSLLVLKFLVGTCHLINYLSASYPELEIQADTWESWSLAVSIHFFVLSAYVWIALMSFDLMTTIRSATLISSRGKKCWRFLVYCLIGWGLPCFAIATFVVLDKLFADPLTEVRVPEYGVYNFFIPPEAQAPYLYYIITGILLVNFIFGIISMTSMLSSLKNSQVFSTGDLSSKSNDYISSRLFIKLFVLTGSLWFLEVISWLHAGQSNPWYYVVTDIIVQLQSVWTFIILVCNSRTLAKLKNKSDKWIGNANKKLADILHFKLQSTRRPSESPSTKSATSAL